MTGKNNSSAGYITTGDRRRDDIEVAAVYRHSCFWAVGVCVADIHHVKSGQQSDKEKWYSERCNIPRISNVTMREGQWQWYIHAPEPVGVRVPRINNVDSDTHIGRKKLQYNAQKIILIIKPCR